MTWNTARENFIKTLVYIGYVAGIVFSYNANAEGEWSIHQSKDEMSGETEFYALSMHVQPTRQLSFPYQDLTSSLGFGCSKDSEWVYIYFSSMPNLVDKEIGNGYSSIDTRIKWDDKIEQASFTQDWGTKFLHFSHGEEVIKKYIKYSTLLLELNWYGAGEIYFEYPLSGASNSIKNARTMCQKG